MKRAIYHFKFDVREALIVSFLIGVAAACGGSKSNTDGTNSTKKGSPHIVIGASGATGTIAPSSLPVPSLPPNFSATPTPTPSST